jgi:HK97 family phage major capsid protein/HK97 family phage prohead protease
MLTRAYTTFEVKSFDDETRIIEGYASTPTPDRGGDVMEPSGAVFALPHPLLWQHKHDQPIGQVIDAKVTPQGIWIKAQLAARGVLPEIDKAWALIKARLVRGFSIGWSPKDATRNKAGGLNVKVWEWLETSAVTIPMNAETSIALIKSIDQSDLAASGIQADGSLAQPAGVTASVVLHAPRRGATAMTPQERIKSLKDTRTTKYADLQALQEKVDASGQTKDAAQRETFDTLKDEIKGIDAELADAEELEAMAVKNATRVEVKTNTEAAAVRGGLESSRVVTLKPNLEKGTLFTRYAMAIAAGKGSTSDALMFARERWGSQTPEVAQFVQDAGRYSKAVEGTTTGTSPGWGSELVYAQNLVSEFIDLLHAREIISRLNGVRRVPFNVRIPSMTGGSTVAWVAEAAPKPVTQPDFGTVTVGYHKMAGIVVLTDELVKLSQPNAEEAVRRDLVEQIVRFMDRQFLDPTITATSARPASITNGVSSPAASGTDADAVYADMNTALATFDAAEVGTDTVHVLMPPSVARAIASLRNALGQFEFVGAGGGMLNTLMGFPVIISSSVPSATMILVKADEILLADDGRVDLDASNQATLDMAGGSTPTFSLYQKNCIAIRAERGVSWAKRRSASVAVIDTIAYAP